MCEPEHTPNDYNISLRQRYIFVESLSSLITSLKRPVNMTVYAVFKVPSNFLIIFYYVLENVLSEIKSETLRYNDILRLIAYYVLWSGFEFSVFKEKTHHSIHQIEFPISCTNNI